MESILLAVVVGIVAIVCSSMVYVLLWKVFKTYFTKYMDNYFEYLNESNTKGIEAIKDITRNFLDKVERIYELEQSKEK